MKCRLSIFTCSLFLFSICIFSCNDVWINDENCETDSTLRKTLRIGNLIDVDTTFNVSKFIDTNYYEIKNLSAPFDIVSKILKVQLFDEKLFVLDENSFLFSFDSSGKLLYKLGEKGSGDMKLTAISDWSFDVKSKRHFIWDDFQKYLKVYDVDGRMIKSLKIPILYSTHFSVLDTNYLVFYNDFNGANKIKTAIYYVNIETGKIEKASFKRDDIKSDSYLSPETSPLYRYKDSAFYYDFYSNIVYYLSQKCPLEYVYIDAEQAALPKEIMTRGFDSTRRQIFHNKEIFIPHESFSGGNFIFLRGMYKQLGRNILFNRANSQNLSFSALKFDLADLSEMYVYDMFFNDDKIVMALYPGVVFDQIHDYKKRKIALPLGLKKFEESYSINDNPILVIAKAKNID